jgi:hypothetical protein
MARVVTYECDQCGSEIVVTETSETVLSPIYCCGLEVLEVSSGKKKKSATGKSGTEVKSRKRPAKKVAAKKTSAKRKKSSSKSR